MGFNSINNDYESSEVRKNQKEYRGKLKNTKIQKQKQKQVELELLKKLKQKTNEKTIGNAKRAAYWILAISSLIGYVYLGVHLDAI
ncbi:hypothetical protein CJF42_25250 [Pseudoalteromonas sp. NBT06-2]|nr:hypothetical protein CJF42_25250 [Pseudoalteromonas sp. NBT06-2]